MRIVKNLDSAFESFKRKISEMSPDAFWGMLGTSIEELKERQQLESRFDTYVSVRIWVPSDSAGFKYLTEDAMLSQEKIFGLALSCDTFANSRAALAS